MQGNLFTQILPPPSNMGKMAVGVKWKTKQEKRGKRSENEGVGEKKGAN